MRGLPFIRPEQVTLDETELAASRERVTDPAPPSLRFGAGGIVIGISGHAGSGKDSAAEALVRSGRFVRVSLADEIKSAAMRWFGFEYGQVYGPSERRNEHSPRYPSGPTARHVLQLLGTEFGRALFPNCWVDCALHNARLHLMASKSVVIPDVRFLNEILGIRAAGGRLVRIKRDGAGLDGAAGAHVSETEQDSIPDDAFDAVIVNDGTLEELEGAVMQLVAGWEREMAA